MIKVKFNSRGFFLSLNMAIDFQLADSGENVNQYIKLINFPCPINFSVTIPCYLHPFFTGLNSSLYSSTDRRVFSYQPNMGYDAISHFALYATIICTMRVMTKAAVVSQFQSSNALQFGSAATVGGGLKILIKSYG